MFFNCNGIAVTLFVLLISCWTKVASAYEQKNELRLQPELIAQPNKCVALNQGRACFAAVNVTWQSEQPGDICLLHSLNSKPLVCWNNATKGQYLYNMEANQDVTLSLTLLKNTKVQINSELSLAQTTIKVSWLYKTNSRKRRWRLF